MESTQSKTFRIDLEQHLALHQNLASCEVVDGRTIVGDDWAAAVRERIKKAKLVVGDCTGLRPEVMFELGFALGLRTPMLPAVAELGADIWPYWLRAKQLGQYKIPGGLAEIVSGIEAHLIDPGHISIRPQKPPVPGLVVWLRRLDWNSTPLEQCQNAARRDELKFETYDDDDDFEQVLTRASIANVLIVSLDGREWDAFGHFICGAIAARPEAGYGGKKIPRRIVVLEPDDVAKHTFTAQGLGRCGPLVTVCKASEVLAELKRFSVAIKHWLQDGTGVE
jgi:hypothetical protein